ncbi:hypothetical protein BaRGS_00020517 [Batillaria attramentaria]|uniref:RGS domain-containing protein n=1 Tax=Batillaria attramentaria TaxID=370345 RepID=A0ABD0KMI2_9CAEN
MSNLLQYRKKEKAGCTQSTLSTEAACPEQQMKALIYRGGEGELADGLLKRGKMRNGGCHSNTKLKKQKPVTPPTGVKGGAAPVKRTPSTRSNPQSPDSLNGDMGLPTSLLGPREPGSSPQLVLSEEVLASLQEPAEAGSTPKSPMKTSSRLSKTLQEILHDKDALHCFIEFMESRQADRFIRFWLDANSFRAATLTRMRSHSLQSVSSSAILKRRTEGKGDGSSGSVDPQRDVADQPEMSSERVEGEEKNLPRDLSCQDTGQSTSAGNRSESNCNCDNQSSSFSNSGAVGCDSDRPSERSKSVEGSTDHTEAAKSAPDGAEYNHISSEGAWLHPSRNPEAHVTANPNTSPQLRPQQSAGHRAEEETSSAVSPVQCDNSLPHSTQEHVISGAHTDASCDTESVDTLTEEPSSSTDSEGLARGAQCEGVNQAVPVIVGADSDISQSSEGSAGDGTVPRQHRATPTEEIQEKLKKSIERDAVGIFTKYIAKDAPQPIGVDDDLREETIRKICREDGQVDPDCFVDCQDFVVRYMEKEYHKLFSDSEYHCKHQVHVLTSGRVYLADILYNEHALCYFMEFMEQEGASHLMQFWMAADNFQQQLIQQAGQYDGMQAQSDAMILYDRFFSLQATMPLGFDDKIRFEVEGNICREEGPLPDCFSKPRDIVLQAMDKVYFPRYLGGDIYYRYISDLVSTVQMSQDLPVRKHKRQASDASSEHSAGSQSLGAESISFRNTLLASGSRTARKSTSSGSLSGSVGKIEEQLGTMDTDFLNPDKLWTQPKKGPLSLGKVNAFGQFVSEFDPDPDGEKKKSGGFFKKKKDKEKEQEEMAMQVAQMILSDVAAMTQMGDVCSRNDRNTNNSNVSTTATTTTTSLSAPASAVSFFEPPPS